jgi:hypothetical protein
MANWYCATCQDLRPSNPKWMMQIYFIFTILFFQNSIIMPRGKNQLGNMDQFKTIDYR